MSAAAKKRTPEPRKPAQKSAKKRAKKTAEPADGGGSSAVLAGVFGAIIRAITRAHEISEKQHVNQLARYSRPIDGDKEHLRPKTIKLQVAMAEGGITEVEVPVLALAPPSSLALKQLQMEFQVRLVGVDDDEEGEVQVAIGEEGRAELEAAMATVKVTVEGVEPPDSVSRIVELLTQQMI